MGEFIDASRGKCNASHLPNHFVNTRYSFRTHILIVCVCVCQVVFIRSRYCKVAHIHSYMGECLSVDSELDCRHGVQAIHTYMYTYGKNLILAERFLLELLCLTKDVKV